MLYLKVFITFVVLLGSSIIGIISFSPVNDTNGTITIQVIDKNGIETINENYIFDESDSLFEILNNNYNIAYREYTVGIILLCIEEVCTNFDSDYIAIYIDGEYSKYGISIIPLEDQKIYSFIYKEID